MIVAYNENSLKSSYLELFGILLSGEAMPKLSALSNMKGGRGNPFKGLGQKAANKAVFYCLSKIKPEFRLSSMVALVGNLQKLAAPSRGISTPANAAAYDVEIRSSGLHPQRLGVTA